MTLSNWLSLREYDPGKAIFLSVSSDGLKASSKLMSVSLLFQSRLHTVFVEGADAYSVFPYTRIEPESYYQLAKPEAEATAKIFPLLAEAEFIVSYAVHKYTMPKLNQLSSLGLSDETDILDVQSICRYLDMFTDLSDIGNECSEAWQLTKAMDREIEKRKKASGYKLDDLFERCGGEMALLPTPDARSQPVKVSWIFNSLLAA